MRVSVLLVSVWSLAGTPACAQEQPLALMCSAQAPAAGSSAAQVPQFRGRPLDEWIADTKSASASVRGDAVWAIGYMGTDAATAIPALRPLLQDKNARVRRWAAWALAKIGPQSNVAIPELIGLLSDRDAQVRHSACWALGMMGEAAKPAVPELAKLLDDRTGFVRGAAAQSLGWIGPQAKEAIPVLAQKLATDPSVRACAAVALSKMGWEPDAALPEFVRLLQDEDWSVRRAAGDCAGQYGRRREGGVT